MMTFSVKDLLALPLLANARVTAGEKGIDRIIRGVTFIEAPDSMNWISENDFLITNTYLIMLNEEIRITLIKKLHQSNAAAIGIKLDRFLTQLPQEMIDIANHLYFPIIILPYDVTPSQIINIVTLETVKNKAFHIMQNHFRQNLLYELLFSKHQAKEVFIKEANALGWDLNYSYGLLVVKSTKPHLTEKVHSIIRLIEKEKDFLVLELNQEIILLLVIDDTNLAKAELLSFANKIKEKCNQELSSVSITIGIGRYYEDLVNLQKSYTEAKNAIFLGSTILNRREVIHFDELGIYRILCDDPIKLQVFYQETVAEMINYDSGNGTEYYKTIEAYIANNCSNSDTAKAMYIHANTVRYRIEKIENLFGVDLTDHEIRLNVKIGMKIAQLISIK